MHQNTPSPFRTLADDKIEYFIEINGETKGPYLRKELQKLFNNKHLGPFDKVKRDGSEEWTEILKIVDIEEPAPQTAYPPPPLHSAPNHLPPHQQFSQPFIAQPQISNNTVAAIINVFFPGVGQMIQERVGIGIAFFFGTILGYILFILPGLIIHIISIVDAANYKPPHKY